jgi:hypothetical protein
MTESSTTIFQIFENIRGKTNYEIDEIKNLLRPFIEKIDVETVTIPAGAFLYRAIKIGKGFGKRKKSKPSDFQHLREIKDVKIGRVNREGQPMLYCSLSKEPPFFETELFNGNELMMGFWQTSRSITLVNIGYTKSVFEKYLDQSLYNHHNLDVLWLGRLSNWKIYSGRTGKVVLEPQIDKDGDYGHDMNGIRCSWVIYDESGKIIEPL